MPGGGTSPPWGGRRSSSCRARGALRLATPISWAPPRWRPSLHLLSEIGTVEIDAWVTELAAELAAGFLALGLPVCGGPPGPHSGNIVSVGQLDEGLHDTTDDKVIGALFQYLIEHGVKMSVRKGVLRFSLHLFNSPADVERVLDLTKQFLNSRHGRNGRGH